MILNSFKTQLITSKVWIPNDRSVLENETYKTEVEDMEQVMVVKRVVLHLMSPKILRLLPTVTFK